MLLAVHYDRVDRIELGPRAQTDLETLRHAVGAGITVALTNGHGETLGLVTGPTSPHASRHLAQARHRLDDERRLDLARRIVDGRLRNQRALLRRLNQRRGLDLVSSVVLGLNRLIRRLPVAKTVDELLGYEGTATAAYWRAWSALLLHGFNLPRRQREAPPDPVNAALNVAASLLARDVGAIVEARGLHRGFGVLHGTSNMQEGCVYDLMEEFRSPLVEGLVLYLFNNRILRDDLFTPMETGALRLGNDAVAAIIRGFEERSNALVKSPRSGHRITWRRLMIEQAEAYAAHVEDRKPYKPYAMDY